MDKGLTITVPGFAASAKITEKRKKKEKVKEPRMTTLLANIKARRRANRKPKSLLSEVVSQLSKKNLKDPSKIKSYIITEKQRDITDLSANLYSLLVRSKISNSRITLSDSIDNKPLSIYVAFDNLTCQSFSNDWLSLGASYFGNLPTFFAKYSVKDETLKRIYMENIKIEEVTIASPPFEADDQAFIKGYIQDYNKFVSFVGVERIADNTLRENFIKNTEKMPVTTFQFDGYNFSTWGNNQASIVTVNTYKPADLVTFFNTTKYLHITQKIKLQPKEVSANKSIKYIYFKIKPEQFCPAYLISPVQITGCTALYKINLDYNTLFKLLKFGAKGYTACFTNMCYWDTLREFLDFLSIMIICDTSNSCFTKENADEYTNAIDFSIKYREVLSLWAKQMMATQKVLVDFYNSFSGKINYDKIIEVLTKLRELKISHNDLIIDSSYAIATKTIGAFRTIGTGLLYKQMIYGWQPFFDDMIKVIETLDSNPSEKVVESLRTICQNIYVMGYNENGDSNLSMFPYILSVGGFLGNLLGDTTDYLKLEIDALKDRTEAKLEGDRLKDTKIVESLKDVERTFRNLIQVNIIKTLASKSLDEGDDALAAVWEDYFDKAMDDITSYYGRNPDAKQAILNEIYKYILISEDPKNKVTITYPPDVQNIINNLVNELAKKKKEAIVADGEKKMKRVDAETSGPVTSSVPVSDTSSIVSMGGSSVGSMAPTTTSGTVSYSHPRIHVKKGGMLYNDGLYTIRSANALADYLDTMNEAKPAIDGIDLSNSNYKLKLSEWLRGFYERARLYPKQKKEIEKITDPAVILRNFPIKAKLVDTVLKSNNNYPDLIDYLYGYNARDTSKGFDKNYESENINLRMNTKIK